MELKNNRKKNSGYILSEVAISLTVIGTLMYAVAKAAVPVMEQTNAIVKQYDQIQVNLNQMYTPTERMEKMKESMKNIDKTKVELTEEQKILVEKTSEQAKGLLEKANSFKH